MVLKDDRKRSLVAVGRTVAVVWLDDKEPRVVFLVGFDTRRHNLQSVHLCGVLTSYRAYVGKVVFGNLAHTDSGAFALHKPDVGILAEKLPRLVDCHIMTSHLGDVV